MTNECEELAVACKCGVGEHEDHLTVAKYVVMLAHSLLGDPFCGTHNLMCRVKHGTMPAKMITKFTLETKIICNFHTVLPEKISEKISFQIW